MRVVDSGHVYELTAGNRLTFVQKDRGEVIREGTTNEEVLEVLIDRVAQAYERLPCQESIRAMHYLKEALASFRERTARRARLKIEGTFKPHYGHFAPADEPADAGWFASEGLDAAAS